MSRRGPAGHFPVGVRVPKLVTTSGIAVGRRGSRRRISVVFCAASRCRADENHRDPVNTCHRPGGESGCVDRAAKEKVINVNPLYQNIFIGVILVAAVAIDQYRRKRRYRT